MPTPGPHTLEDRERTALGVLASSMFAEAQELPADSALAACLGTYVAQLLRPGGGRERGRPRTSYELHAAVDLPVFRRLATVMDALSLGLGPRSGVGRALSSWAARVTLAVAEAERRRVAIYGPSNDLLAMVAALRAQGEDAVAERLAATHPELLEHGDLAEPAPPDGERLLRTGRVWIRSHDGAERRPGRRRR